MDELLEVADRLWRRELDIARLGPLGGELRLHEVAAPTADVVSFARVSALSADEGLVLVDTGQLLVASQLHEALRGYTPDRLVAAVFSTSTTSSASARSRKRRGAQLDRPACARPRGHGSPVRALQAGERLQRRRQRPPVPAARAQLPDRVPRRDLPGGGHRAKGETDDNTWTYLPGRKVLAGDLFIWCSPNAGNPQKVPRYPLEWAAALSQLTECGAELFLPGHGCPDAGRSGLPSP